VPGREGMKEQQLVPHVAVNEHGKTYWLLLSGVRITTRQLAKCE
jgi:hypothetical protein